MREIAIIESIKKIVGKPGAGVKLGIGDDTAVLEWSKDEYLLFSSDMIVENTHFRLPSDRYERIGWKAAAVNISDIAAMGGVPKYITVSLGIPKNFQDVSLKALYRGIKKITAKFGVTIVGGDLNRSEKLVIDVAIIGNIKKRALVTRSGAKEGDRVFITGPVRDGKKCHLSFLPRVKEARYLTGKYRINSMIDVSDGIAPDLWRICRASGLGASLSESLLSLAGSKNINDSLYYGESFELVFTLPVKEAASLEKDVKMRTAPYKFFPIGMIVAQKYGVVMADNKGVVSPVMFKGYEHL
ncbi:MAG: thiamine-monophosphate kinase [Candidatus Omnitrophica bacterium]|nr:thiamine-monophosphate kinase [Candidatus Omnitrophota bacterium]